MTNISIQNNLSSALAVATSVNPSLSSSYWGIDSNTALNGVTTKILWMNRDEGIKDGSTWVFTTAFTIDGVAVQLQEKVTGTFADSDIWIQIVAGSRSTGWQSANTALTFTGASGKPSRVVGTFVSHPLESDDVTYTVTQATSQGIFPQIEHVVVLMMENRSMDNLLGWLYPAGEMPALVIPPGSARSFNGLPTTTSWNSNPKVKGDDGTMGGKVWAKDGTTNWPMGGSAVSKWYVPTPDPGEQFDNVTLQIYNGGNTANMSGFVTNFLTQLNAADDPANNAAEIMQSYSTEQLPVISALAKAFATSDAWYASVPTQTWPNRGFVHTGSANGFVNNTDPIEYPWAMHSVFDVLTSEDINWTVYNDGHLPSLVKAMFWNQYALDTTHFKGIEDFQTACNKATSNSPGALPPYSFLEPNFWPDSSDESYHPPADVRLGEQFLSRIYSMIQASPYRDKILFVVLFDEHGGTYDHATPPAGAAQPYPYPVARDTSGFTFQRFGVRTPAIVISSYVEAGTVFRTSTNTPLDHTSLLATLRDWLGLQTTFASMMPSPRIAAAPNIAPVLTATEPRAWPSLPALSAETHAAIAAISEPDDATPLNDMQRMQLRVAAATIAKMHPTLDIPQPKFDEIRTHGDARALWATLQPNVPERW